MGADGWVENPIDFAGKSVWVAGHNGLLGSAICRRLQSEDCKLITASRLNLDLRNQEKTYEFCLQKRPDIIILAAAKVGGIAANINAPADFIHDNLVITSNVIEAAHRANVNRLLFLGSSCMYPAGAKNPITEDMLMSGLPEITNAPYAIAKIAGLVMTQSYRRQYGRDYIAAIPCNLYGPHDRFDLENSHVIPALIMKAHASKARGERVLNVWGSGKPAREFLHADDAADALVFMLKHYSSDRPINIGAGQDMAIADIAAMIARIAGLEDGLVFDQTRPDGVMCKLMDSSRIYKAGWRPQIALEEGLRRTYAWYVEECKKRIAA